MCRKLCVVESCDREAEVRDEWCRKHYNSGRRFGTIELLTDEERFWQNVQITGFCWLWTGKLGAGDSRYGRFGADSMSHLAHRYAYEMLVGPIPEGFTLDHLCRITNCVNPDHLEPIEHVGNTMRGFGPMAENARKLKCHLGHVFDEANTHYGTRKDGRTIRYCRACGRIRARKYHQKQKEKMMHP